MSLSVDVTLLDRPVCFSAEGGVLGLWGPSGWGKTTLIRAIAGLTRVPGNITWDGGPWQSQDTWVPPEHRRVGWVPQEPLLFTHKTVAQNLGAGSHRARTDRLAEVVEVLELGSLLERLPTTLSGGEARRVSLGRALCSDPALLLLDEPLTGLDRPLKRRVVGFLRRAQRHFRIPTLVVSHDPWEHQRLCDEVLLLSHEGVVLREAPRRALLDPRAGLDDTAVDNVFEGQVTTVQGRPSASRGNLVLHTFPTALPDGAQVLIEVRSQDILVASQSPGPVSAQNVFQVTITDITEREEGCLVHLQASEDAPTLVATVGHQSIKRLGLTRGHPAWAVIKASAIRVVEA